MTRVLDEYDAEAAAWPCKGCGKQNAHWATSTVCAPCLWSGRWVETGVSGGAMDYDRRPVPPAAVPVTAADPWAGYDRKQAGK